MPRTTASNGIRPEIRALAVFRINKPVTPKEINDCVGTGDYAAKYVSFLNTRYGFTIEAQRDGRRVVSYTLVAEPANVADLRSMQPKTTSNVVAMPKAKPAPAYKPVKVSMPKPAPVQKAAAAKVKVASKPKVKDEVVETFGSSGSVGSVDADWDSVDGVDLRKIV
jgi:hypothetical protein